MVKRIIAVVMSLVVVISCICAFFFNSDYHEYTNLSYGEHKRQKLDRYILIFKSSNNSYKPVAVVTDLK